MRIDRNTEKKWKLMTFLVVTNIVARRPLKHPRTGTPTAFANKFFDPNTPSLRKGRDREKQNGMENNVVYSGH